MNVLQPSLEARLAGACYVLTTVLGVTAYSLHGRVSDMLNFVAALFYLLVTVLLYRLFRPVQAGVSLVAVGCSVAGCGLQILDTFNCNPFHINNIIFFGFYCVLISILIARSLFLPRVLAVCMAVAGVSWLTYLSPQLGRRLSAYSFVAGLLGEGLFTLWLLWHGVDEVRWREQAAQ